MADLRVGSGFRDMAQGGQRVVFVVALDTRYAYVRSERAPHRRSRILRSRLCSSAFEWVGEFNMDEPRYWPKWFAETQPERTQG